MILTSEIFEARYNAILELLYHIMDRPAKPPEKKIALHAKMRCFTYSFAMTMTKVNCFHKYGSEKKKYVPSKTPKDNFSLIVDIEGKNGKDCTMSSYCHITQE